jgi:hypothetical protein
VLLLLLLLLLLPRLTADNCFAQRPNEPKLALGKPSKLPPLLPAPRPLTMLCLLAAPLPDGVPPVAAASAVKPNQVLAGHSLNSTASRFSFVAATAAAKAQPGSTAEVLRCCRLAAGTAGGTEFSTGSANCTSAKCENWRTGAVADACTLASLPLLLRVVATALLFLRLILAAQPAAELAPRSAHEASATEGAA